MIDYSVIGSRIRQYRLDRGITQEDLTFRIRTSTAYISSIERGIKKPNFTESDVTLVHLYQSQV